MKKKPLISKLKLSKEVLHNLEGIKGKGENTFFSYCYCATMQQGCLTTNCPILRPKPLPDPNTFDDCSHPTWCI